MTTEALGQHGPSFASRAAARARWEARYGPVDPQDGLVCIFEEEQPLEDRRTKAFVGVQRLRTYAHKNQMQTIVAQQVDDGPLMWREKPAPTPLQARPVGILRRWSGNRPTTGRNA